MALRTPTAAAAPATPAGKFEAPEGESTTVETVTPPANDPVAAAPAPAATAANDPVPVAATTSAVATTADKAQAGAFAKAVADMKGAADFAYGNYPVFKGNNGEIVQTGSNSLTLGRWAKVTMIAWDEHFEVSPGSKSEKSKDAVGYSRAGLVMDSIIGSDYAGWVGKPMAEYVNYLQNDGDYPQAKSGRFIDIACVVHQSESDETLVGEIIQVTLSQSSIPSFGQYQEKLLMKARAVALGIPGVTVPTDPFTFFLLRELASKGDNKWTKLRVLDKLPAKL